MTKPNDGKEHEPVIAIINQGERNEKGETLYHLQINTELVGKFYHTRVDGLPILLKKASIAAQTAEYESWIHGLAEIDNK